MSHILEIILIAMQNDNFCYQLLNWALKFVSKGLISNRYSGDIHEIKMYRWISAWRQKCSMITAVDLDSVQER